MVIAGFYSDRQQTKKTQKGAEKMKYSGLWKIKAAQQWDEKTMGLVEKNVEDILADQSLSDDDKKMLYSQFLFTDDGWIKTMLPIPEGMDKAEIDELIASGEFELYGDDMLVFEKKPWKEEDGKIKFDTGTKGEVFGEAVDPWTEIPQADDGSIKYVTYTLVKAD